MDSKQVTGLITWTAVPWVLSRVKASHRVRAFGLRSCCCLERNCGFGSVLCTSGFSSKAKVGTLLSFKFGCNVPIHVLTIYCCPRDGPFSPLGCSQTFMPLLSPYIWQSDAWRVAAWRVRFCMFSWLISQSQHFLMKAREGMKAQLVGNGCRDWSCPIWQQPTDPIIWFVKPQPK